MGWSASSRLSLQLQEPHPTSFLPTIVKYVGHNQDGEPDWTAAQRLYFMQNEYNYYNTDNEIAWRVKECYVKDWKNGDWRVKEGKDFNVCRRHGVRHFPTFRFYGGRRTGGPPTEITGHQSASSLIDFIRANLHPGEVRTEIRRLEVPAHVKPSHVHISAIVPPCPDAAGLLAMAGGRQHGQFSSSVASSGQSFSAARDRDEHRAIQARGHLAHEARKKKYGSFLS
mmetsp:Transcript_77169/g.136688  ORF Transcript_77169/g.136688 Transcript_77169/m.136688 type:complete len:226 (+) Transcript_77169:24-701(+)